MDTAKLPPGLVLDGRYRVDQLLALGGMGAVYRGTHLVLHKRVAIKVLRSDVGQHEQMVQRFQREAIAASAIGHENIVAVHDMGTTTEGVAYLVMDLLEGKNLGELITTEAPFDIAAACDIVLEVLSGMAAAHHAGIVHRDLKPENIFLAERTGGGERVKILDFGVSRLGKAVDHTPDVRLTTTGMIMGTPSYMSPEQARGDIQINHATDIYAAAVILYEMLAGQRPYGEHNYNVLVHKILSAETVPLAQHRPEVPRELAAAIERGMALKPADRFATSEEFAVAIAPFSSDPKAAPALPLTLPRARRGTAATEPAPTPAPGPAEKAPPLPPGVKASAPRADVVAVKPAPAAPARAAAPPRPAAAASAPPPVPSAPPPRPKTAPLPPQAAAPAAATARPSAPPPPPRPDSEADFSPPSRPGRTSFADERREPPARSTDARVVKIGVIATLVVVGGAAAFLFFRRGKDDAPRKEDPAATVARDAGAKGDPTGATGREPAQPADPDRPTPGGGTAEHPRTGGGKPKAEGNVVITFEVQPRDAVITVDGYELSSPVFRTEKSDAAAFVRIEAPGHQPYTGPVSLDRDDTVRVTLKKEPTPAPPPDQPPPSDPPPTPPDTPIVEPPPGDPPP